MQSDSPILLQMHRWIATRHLGTGFPGNAPQVAVVERPGIDSSGVKRPKTGPFSSKSAMPKGEAFHAHRASSSADRSDTAKALWRNRTRYLLADRGAGRARP